MTKTILTIAGSRKNRESFIDAVRKLRNTWIFHPKYIHETDILFSEESLNMSAEFFNNQECLDILVTIDKFLKTDTEVLLIREPDNQKFIDELKNVYGIYTILLVNTNEELSNIYDCTFVVDSEHFTENVKKLLNILNEKDK